MTQGARIGGGDAERACATEEVILAFVEDRLRPAERATLASHLADCGACGALVAAATAAWFPDVTADRPVSNAPEFVEGQRFGPYTIVAFAGRGSMGEVYRARDPRLARDVAIKMLPERFAKDPERLARFQREARATGGIAHPNTVTLFDVGTENGMPYLVTEWLEGTTLRDRLVLGALPTKHLLRVGVQITSGLAAAHARGVIHRDLKPANLFLCTDGACKILDFGLARLTESLGEGAATEAGTLLGTAGYMSPEQVRGEAVDERADLFAVGAILYEMSTGRPAFGGGSPVERMSATLRDEPAAVSGELGAVIGRCLAKEPGERFRSAHDLAFHLAALEARSGAAIEPTEVHGSASAPRSAIPRASGRRRLVARVAAILGSVAAGFFLHGSMHRHPMSAERPVYRPLTFSRAPIVSARFANRGQTAIYSAGADGAPAQLFSVSTERPGSTAIGVAGNVLAISPQGELALVLPTSGPFIGTLARMPLSGGAPRRVLEDVLEADWNPENGELAITHLGDHQCRLEYPIGTVRFTTENLISEIRFSPHGDRIAFLLHPFREDDAGTVTILERDGSVRELAGGWSSVRGLAWAAGEPEEIWFTASRHGFDNQLFAVDLDGHVRLVDRVAGRVVLQDIAPDGRVLVDQQSHRGSLIVGSADGEHDLTWSDSSSVVDFSSDGRTVLFVEDETREGNDYAAYLRTTDGAPPVRLGKGTPLALSPDGRWAVTLRRTTPVSLWLLPTGPGAPRQLPLGTIATVVEARFFPDSRRFVLSSGDPDRVAQLQLYDIESLSSQPIAHGISGPFQISRDGERIASLDAMTGVLRLFSAQGDDLGALPQRFVNQRIAGWTDDDTAVYLYTLSLPMNVTRVDLASGTTTPHMTLPKVVRAGLVSITPLLLSADGRSYAYSSLETQSRLYVVEGLAQRR